MSDNKYVEYVVEETDDAGMPTGNSRTIKLPRPMGWKLLVKPKRAKKVSAGGLILVDETSEAEEAMIYIGKVLAIGEAAFKTKTQGGIDLSTWDFVPEVGDWVVYAPFAGQKMRVKGDDSIILLLNDTEIQGLVDNPDEYWSWLDA